PRPPPRPSPFPYTTLFRSVRQDHARAARKSGLTVVSTGNARVGGSRAVSTPCEPATRPTRQQRRCLLERVDEAQPARHAVRRQADRKSTRLNSSHQIIPYA